MCGGAIMIPLQQFESVWDAMYRMHIYIYEQKSDS